MVCLGPWALLLLGQGRAQALWLETGALNQRLELALLSLQRWMPAVALVQMLMPPQVPGEGHKTQGQDLNPVHCIIEALPRSQGGCTG